MAYSPRKEDNLTVIPYFLPYQAESGHEIVSHYPFVTRIAVWPSINVDINTQNATVLLFPFLNFVYIGQAFLLW